MIRIFLLSLLLVSQTIAGEATIHPGDTIHLRGVSSTQTGISYLDEDIISSYYHVDEAGMINLVYIGKITVGGLSASDAAHRIKEDYVSKGMFAVPIFTVSIGGPDPSIANVKVSGPVQHPGRYQMKTPATIEQAFVLAGGWSGSGENGVPAKFCDLNQDVEGKIVHTRIRIHINRKTKQITVLDQTWKDYRLMEGDRIGLEEVLL